MKKLLVSSLRVEDNPFDPEQVSFPEKNHKNIISSRKSSDCLSVHRNKSREMSWTIMMTTSSMSQFQGGDFKGRMYFEESLGENVGLFERFCLEIFEGFMI